MNVGRWVAGLCAAVCVAVLPAQAQAQTTPSKPIKVSVGHPAGGAMDIVARTVGQQPTIAGSGHAGFQATDWSGFVAPAATPKPVIARLHAEVQKALASNDMRERLASAGGEVIPASIEQFAALIESERLRYERLIRDADIKPD